MLQVKGTVVTVVCTVVVTLSIFLIWYFQGKNDKLEEIGSETDNFILNLNNCKVPRVQIINKNLLNFWNNQSQTTNCLLNDQFSGLVDDDKTLALYGNDTTRCCYQEIIPLDDPKGYRFSSKCLEFQKSSAQMENKEFLLVQCTSNDKIKVNYNFHATIPLKKDPSDKGIFWESNFGKIDRPVSVLMIVLDATSRNHALRSLPKTMNYLQNLQFTDFKGHHIQEEILWINLLSMLGLSDLSNKTVETSKPVQHVENTSELNSTSTMDDDSLFSIFSKLNYITMYADTSETFLDPSSKLQRPKVDYDLKAFLKAHKEHKEASLEKLKAKGDCFGNETTTDYILNYIRRFIKKFEVVPTFSVSVLSENGQTRVESLSKHDEAFLKFFKSLFQSGEVLENTLVIFTSPQGYLDHPYSKTHDGYIDRRLPFLYTRLPNRLTQQKPIAFKAFRINQHRITSHRDTYQTLITIAKTAYDILKTKNLTQEVFHSQNPSANQTVGLSLINDILPPSRTCHDAGITPIACACGLPASIEINSSKILDKLDYTIPDNVILPDPSDTAEMHGKIE